MCLTVGRALAAKQYLQSLEAAGAGDEGESGGLLDREVGKGATSDNTHELAADDDEPTPAQMLSARLQQQALEVGSRVAESCSGVLHLAYAFTTSRAGLWNSQQGNCRPYQAVKGRFVFRGIRDPWPRAAVPLVRAVWCSSVLDLRCWVKVSCTHDAHGSLQHSLQTQGSRHKAVP